MYAFLWVMIIKVQEILKIIWGTDRPSLHTTPKLPALTGEFNYTNNSNIFSNEKWSHHATAMKYSFSNKMVPQRHGIRRGSKTASWAPGAPRAQTECPLELALCLLPGVSLTPSWVSAWFLLLTLTLGEETKEIYFHGIVGESTLVLV